MTAGDTINYLIDLAPSGGNVNYQPASGVEIAVTSCSSERGDGQVSLTNSTIEIEHWYRSSTTSNWSNNGSRLMINNTNYLKLYNYSSATGTLGFSGIQIK